MNLKRLIKEAVFHPSKFLNVIGMQLMVKFKPIKTYFYPSFVGIEPTTNCNLNCVMCQITSIRKKRDLNFESFKKIIDFMPYTRVIDLQGIGEPFLCKDFFKMVDYANSEGIRVYTFTNANLMNEEVSRKIISHKLEQVIISIDGATKKTYETIRRGANFDIFLKNVKYLFSIRDPKKLKLIAWIVPNTYNLEELEDIVKLCNEINFDRVVLQSKLSLFSYKADLNKKLKKLSVNNEESFKRKLEEISRKYKNIEICRGKNLSEKNQCAWPWSSVFISSEGNIVPCCVISDPDVVSFGNIFKEGFKKIWNNEDYKNLRKNIKENKIPSYCSDCYL